MTEFLWHEPKDLSREPLRPLLGQELVVHVKGFARGVDYEHPHNMASRGRFLDVFRSICDSFQACAVVFDGDSYCSTSYTYLMAMLPAEFPHVTFHYWAVVRSIKELGRFESSWKNSPLPMINVIPTSNLNKHSSFAELGVQLLRATNSEHVVCIGGGDVVREEQEVAERRGVLFHVLDFVRVNPKHGELERHYLYTGAELLLEGASPQPR